jgi:hypothetical protein
VHRGTGLVLIALSLGAFGYAAERLWPFLHLVHHGVKTQAVIHRTVEEEVESNDDSSDGLVTVA